MRRARAACWPTPGSVPPLADPGVTVNALLGGRLRLAQPAGGLRAGSDAVLLAAAVPARAGERAIEAGCGTGAALLCLAARVPELRLTGIELQPELAELARANAVRNGFADRIDIVVGDILEPPASLAGSFDHAFANPPFFAAGRHDRSPDAGRARARGESAPGDLGRWLDFMLAMVRPGGTVTVIQRAERLPELLAGLHGRAGAIAVFPLWPGGDKPAKRLIVQARRGSAAPARLLPGLVLHRPDGAYSAATERVLRDGAALALD